MLMLKMMSGRKVVTVAAWVATVLVVAWAEGEGGSIAKFCEETSYKETCLKSVAKANSTDPHELIKATLNAAVEELQRVIKGTGVYKKLRSDKSTQGAIAICEKTLNKAIDDLILSFDRIDQINEGEIEHNVAHIRNWLSATTAHRSACIDAFDDTTGDTGKKVKQMLVASKEFLSNSLSLVAQIQDALSSLSDLGDEIADKMNKHELGPGEEPSDEESIPEHARKLLDGEPAPKFTVAKDGSGDCKTVNEAIQRMGGKNTERVVILVKAGVYEEYVMIPKGLNNLNIIGEGALNTIITGKKSFAGGVRTWESGTVQVDADGFMARDITFENTAPISQAVALRVSGKLAVFYRCHIKGFQDTLYAQAYMQFYRECRISGTVDFTFGDAKAVFQKCDFVARKHPEHGSIMVTAQGKDDPKSDGAYVIHDCRIIADDDFLHADRPQKAYLGRPWKPFATVVVMQSFIGDCIQPEGWSPWQGSFFQNTLFYAEWDNRGPIGKDQSRRPKDWGGYQKDFTEQKAQAFLPQTLYKDDSWIRQSGVPYDPGFIAVDANEDNRPTTPNPTPAPVEPTPTPTPVPNPTPTPAPVEPTPTPTPVPNPTPTPAPVEPTPEKPSDDDDDDDDSKKHKDSSKKHKDGSKKQKDDLDKKSDGSKKKKDDSDKKSDGSKKQKDGSDKKSDGSKKQKDDSDKKSDGSKKQKDDSDKKSDDAAKKPKRPGLKKPKPPGPPKKHTDL